MVGAALDGDEPGNRLLGESQTKEALHQVCLVATGRVTTFWFIYLYYLHATSGCADILSSGKTTRMTIA